MPSKNYSIRWENDEPVSFEVNGRAYRSLDEVPDPKDRAKLAAMAQAAEEEDAFADFNAKEFEEARKNAVEKTEKILVRVFFGVAALTLLISAVASFFNIRKLSREASAPGVVVEIVQKRQYVNEQDRVYEDFYFPVVEFRATDGKTRRAQMTEGSNFPSYEVGEQVVVLYDPNHPLNARIKSAGSAILMWILPGITGVLGISFAAAAWMISAFLSPAARSQAFS